MNLQRPVQNTGLSFIKRAKEQRTLLQGLWLEEGNNRGKNSVTMAIFVNVTSQHPSPVL